MKRCRACRVEKDESEFGNCKKTKSGLLARCKSCMTIAKRKSKNKNREEYLRKSREYAKREYEKNPDKYRERHKKWIENNLDKYIESNKKSCKKKYENNKEYYAKQSKSWKEINPERTKELARKHSKISKERYPEKNQARLIVSGAIRKGEIVRPTICSRCKKEGYIEGHHYDFNKPLDVIWLCRKCHAKEHLQNKRKKDG